jgi:hypothetical protein
VKVNNWSYVLKAGCNFQALLIRIDTVCLEKSLKINLAGTLPPEKGICRETGSTPPQVRP